MNTEEKSLGKTTFYRFEPRNHFCKNHLLCSTNSVAKLLLPTFSYDLFPRKHKKKLKHSPSLSSGLISHKATHNLTIRYPNNRVLKELSAPFLFYSNKTKPMSFCARHRECTFCFRFITLRRSQIHHARRLLSIQEQTVYPTED